MLINHNIFIEVLLAEYTPSMGMYGFRSEFLNDLQKRGIWEVGRFPAYMPDDICSYFATKDRKMLHYISMQGGVWLITHAGVKSLLCDLENMNGRSMAFDMEEINESTHNVDNSKDYIF